MAYLDTLLVDAPSIVYKLDEASGSSVTDYSGNSDTGTIVGTVGYRVPGPAMLGYGMDFTTSGDLVKNTNTLNFAIATLEVWAKIPVAPGSTSQVVGFVQANSIGTSDKDVMATSTGKIRWYGFDGGTKTDDSTNVVTNNFWRHIVCVANGTTLEMYVDAVNVSTLHTACGNTFTGYAAGQPSIQLGGNQTGLAAIWQAQSLAWFSVYNSALSAARIQAHFLEAQSAVQTPANFPSSKFGPF